MVKIRYHHEIKEFRSKIRIATVYRPQLLNRHSFRPCSRYEAVLHSCVRRSDGTCSVAVDPRPFKVCAPNFGNPCCCPACGGVSRMAS